MNRLSKEKNLYLKQHQNNPIDWQVWDKSLFDLAKEKNLLLFISIGYSTCHWCHVMERETFSSEQVASLLRKHFLAIKIDREERPDLDSYYMKSLQVQGIAGGWPLNVFALPDVTASVSSSGASSSRTPSARPSLARPFWGGTYFPAQGKMGIPGFIDILKMIVKNWQEKPEQVLERANIIHEAIYRSTFKKEGEEKETLNDNLLDIKYELFIEDKEFLDLHLRYFDAEHGGFKFNNQNKFCNFLNLLHLVKIAHNEKNRDLLEKIIFTTKKFSWGGIYDHLAGGICRYSTDSEWKLPHFEKMLYDNALYLWLLRDLFLITKDDFYRERAYEVIKYLENKLHHQTKVRAKTKGKNEGDLRGGFFSAEDADSEGEEGKFYFWTGDEIKKALSGKGGAKDVSHQHFYNFFAINQVGSNEKITLHSAISLEEYIIKNGLDKNSLDTEAVKKEFYASLEQLNQVRKKRIAPSLDNKIILAWNALTIIAYASSGRAFSDPSLTRKAEADVAFIMKNFARDKRGGLYRRLAQDERGVDGGVAGGLEGKHWAYLEDYALWGLALMEVYESTFITEAYKSTFIMEAHESTFNIDYLEESHKTLKYILSNFYEDGKFYRNEVSQSDLPMLDLEKYDGVEPSGISALVHLLLRSSLYHQKPDYEELALGIMKTCYPEMKNTSLPFMLSALHDYKRGYKEIHLRQEEALKQQGNIDLLRTLDQSYLPERVSCLDFLTKPSKTGGAKTGARKTGVKRRKAKGKANANTTAPQLVICKKKTCFVDNVGAAGNSGGKDADRADRMRRLLDYLEVGDSF